MDWASFGEWLAQVTEQLQATDGGRAHRCRCYAGPRAFWKPCKHSMAPGSLQLHNSPCFYRWLSVWWGCLWCSMLVTAGHRLRDPRAPAPKPNEDPGVFSCAEEAFSFSFTAIGGSHDHGSAMMRPDDVGSSGTTGLWRLRGGQSSTHIRHPHVRRVQCSYVSVPRYKRTHIHADAPAHIHVPMAHSNMHTLSHAIGLFVQT
ncbi:hypothetical protein GGR56DRAFT_564945 [Xylariaceae sp. FL0804]|nr:hypothetical protein GGR56DRAFT_564945 [Xylariaceae sp. FL0804]